MQAVQDCPRLEIQPSFSFIQDHGYQPVRTRPKAARQRKKNHFPKTSLERNLFSFWEYEELELCMEIEKFWRAVVSAGVLNPGIAVFVVTTAITQFQERQLYSKENSIVRMVPRMKVNFLNRHFPSFVGNDEELSELAIRLANQCKTRIGDVVQISRSEIEEMMIDRPEALERLEERLENIGLSFGVVAPWWKSPGGIYGPNW